MDHRASCSPALRPLALLPLALLLTACPTISGDTKPGPIDTGTPDDTDTGLPPDTDDTPEDTGPFDVDGDGHPAATDCNDHDPSIHPDAAEACNGMDDDCDGTVDEDVRATWYLDLDGDGYGDASTATLACEAPLGMVADGTDCDDTRADTWPGAPERCDLLDNDCDGIVDEDLVGTWYADVDGDGWGDAAAPAADCDPGPGFAATPGDCDDHNSSIHPDAEEVCDHLDNDCDALVDTDDPDAAVTATWYTDADGDGWGDAASASTGCVAPSGTSAVPGDCDDADASVHPEAEEICDGADDDCDSLVDDDDPDVTGPSTWYADADGDGWGDDTSAVTACDAPVGTVAWGGDCDDADPAFHPSAPEEDCTDPADYNCDGSVGWEDADGDGFAACTECDDTRADVHPDAAEVCDGLDNDCDGTVDAGATDAATWYADGDGDGFGDPATAEATCEPAPGSVATGDDCDDTQARAFPGGEELCDGLDNDCDGLVDNSATDAVAWYADADGDGWGDPVLTLVDCAPPSGWVPSPGDCDEADPAVHPGAAEACNGVDDDCDGTVDEADAAEAATWYTDADGDGYGDPATAVVSCTAPSGTVADGTDCDDADSSSFPGAPELCDSLDNDCDAAVDEDGTTDARTWYADGDGDGWGDPSVTQVSCTPPSGFVPEPADCDDGDAAVNPAAVEVCNDVDDDCDGTVDEADAADAATWYADADGDGFGDASLSTVACDAPAGYVSDASDCDDAAAGTRPDAVETCDGVDDDCDGFVDEDDAADAPTWHADADGDGWGDPAAATVACAAPTGFVSDASDCDDTTSAVHPAATETCNGVDDDCDGTVDEADATDALTWYADTDGDGWGDTDTATQACTAPAGHVDRASDCDDTRASVHPGATETCNGRDDDCDGTTDEPDAADALTWYADTDGDGWGNAGAATDACTAPSGWVADATDCDDLRSGVNPGATETCDGLDDDCDGATDEPDAADAATWFADTDGDGWGDGASSTRACTAPTGFVSDDADCDDAAASTHPTAPEACNGVDDDCDGAVDDGASDATPWYADTDGDGWGDAGHLVTDCAPPTGYVGSATDCDDGDATIHPGATEVCNDTDDDCDGTTDEPDAADALAWYADTDGDGYGDPDTVTRACTTPAGHVADDTDCDDGASSVHPGATETCNGVDDDCDGTVDESSAADAGTWYTDADGDRYGDPSTGTRACTAPAGTVSNATDCDDADTSVHPGATERCDDQDEDCDGSVDEGAVDAGTWYADLDEDGYGDPTEAVVACDGPSGYVADESDCDDLDADIHPGAAEWCDGLDTDCSGDLSWLEQDPDGNGLLACEQVLWLRTDSATNNSPTATGTYGSYTTATMLESLGTVITSTNNSTTTLTSSLLDAYGVVITVGTASYGSLDASESAALGDWVNDGGSYLHVAYHPMSTTCDFVNALPTEFGISCGDWSWYWSDATSTVASHFITTGVSSGRGVGAELWTVRSPAKTLMSWGSYPFVVVNDVGAGRFVGVADEWFLYNPGTGTGDLSTADHETLVENIWLWLTDLPM